jgi:hypothetical protein
MKQDAPIVVDIEEPSHRQEQCTVHEYQKNTISKFGVVHKFSLVSIKTYPDITAPHHQPIGGFRQQLSGATFTPGVIRL